MNITCKCGAELPLRPYNSEEYYDWEDASNEARIYNSLYGCDSGCEFVRFEIDCHECGESWDDGVFGSFENEAEFNGYVGDMIAMYS